MPFKQIKMKRYFVTRSCVWIILISIVIIFGIVKKKKINISRTDRKLLNGISLKTGHKELGNLIPGDDVIDTMSNDERDELYWMRFGSIRDGGKYVCLDQPYKPVDQCIVYSFGSNFQFDFEEAVERHFKCVIHTFDPSKPIPINRKPDVIHFHYIGLGAENKLNDEGWNLKTLSSLQSTLNHTERVIDILKIDIEKSEWSVLPEILESGSLHNVKQLCIEIHYNTTQSSQQLKILRRLYEAGFHIFMHEPNHTGRKLLRYPYNSMTTINELSLINIKWMK